ncbi:hypothetical protein ABZP36_019255 [Zizania latifolia]
MHMVHLFVALKIMIVREGHRCTSYPSSCSCLVATHYTSKTIPQVSLFLGEAGVVLHVLFALPQVIHFTHLPCFFLIILRMFCSFPSFRHAPCDAQPPFSICKKEAHEHRSAAATPKLDCPKHKLHGLQNLLPVSSEATHLLLCLSCRRNDD